MKWTICSSRQTASLANSLRRRLLACAGIGLALTILAGCSSPPKPVLSQIQLGISASSDLNPDARNRPSPVSIRVYALKTATAFETADFFTLFEKDTVSLGPDLVKREDVLLRPGETKTLELSLPAEAKVLAVLIAYRDLERARWRLVRVIEVGKVTNLKIKGGARQATIE